jgi:geranylgeranyl reductase family protein
MSARYDVAVIGAGPAGAAAAWALARRGARVLLLDKAAFPRDKTCGDGLSPRALGVLEAMGLLAELGRQGGRATGLDFVAPGGGAVSARVPALGGPGYALVVPRRILDEAVRQRAVAAGAAVAAPVRVTAVEPAGDGVTVRGERAGRVVAYGARLAVVATGASPALPRGLGLPGGPPAMLAARAYYAGLRDLPDHLQFRFDHTPLPGYGWVFPLSAEAANIGAGIMATGLAARWLPATPRAAFDRFVAGPGLRTLLAGARQVGPVQGYPLRTDFGRAPAVVGRVLLAGEAAGLVNPLTGEGIDYALESGRLAGEFLAARLADGDLAPAALAGYDRLLRQRYQALFVFCRRVQALCVNRLLLGPLVAWAGRRPDLKDLLVAVVLGGRDLNAGVSLRRVARRLLAP